MWEKRDENLICWQDIICNAVKLFTAGPRTDSLTGRRFLKELYAAADDRC